jgi:LysM repeat protein
MVGLLTSMVSVAVWPATTTASSVDVLANGGFEQGFGSQSGCGMVGGGWQCFTNGGAANYGFYDDQWERTVAAGKHSQLIEINTKGMMLGDADRYAGIYQTVPVLYGGQYLLNLSGMIRTTNLEGDPWRYRVQVGWTYGPSANWQSVSNWKDVGWDTYYERTNPGPFLSFGTNVTAESDYVTLYVRAWKKWGVGNEEIDINLDSISLLGPSPFYQQPVPPIYPVEPGCVSPCVPEPQPQPPVVLPVPPIYPVAPGCADPCVPQPLPPVGVCAGPDYVYNGNFESGFNPMAVGHIGNSWGYFTNGGAANYGFYDDQWPRVVADGKHSQLIEINTKGVYPADNDRYAGIYQYITGLYPGVQYEFRMKGLLRGAGNEDDPYRFAAQVGYLPGYQSDWGKVGNWTEMNLGPIGVRTDPGAMTEYTMKFTASSSDLTLFIRGWKKWAITNVEMDFNIDSVSLRACQLYGTGGPVTPPGVYPSQPVAPGYSVDPGYWVEPVHPVDPGYSVDPGYGYDGGQATCSYTVASGDTLAWVAQSMGVSQYDLIAANGIANPDFIYVGQVLTNPNCGSAGYGLGAAPTEPYVESYAAAGGYAAGGYDAGYDAQVVDYPMASAAPTGEMGAGEMGASYAAAAEDGNEMYADYPAGDYAASGYSDTGYSDTGYDGSDYSAGYGDTTAALPSGETYTVRPGDNLSQIAAGYGVAVGQVLQANGIQNPNIIYVGQQLVIP